MISVIVGTGNDIMNRANRSCFLQNASVILHADLPCQIGLTQIIENITIFGAVADHSRHLRQTSLILATVSPR